MKPSLSSESYISGGHIASGLHAADSRDRDQFRAGLGVKETSSHILVRTLVSEWVLARWALFGVPPVNQG